MIETFVMLSSCDSRNLNLSPFCNLSSTTMAMWQPSILETYGNLTTTYVNQTSGPMRLKYPNSMGKRELITSLTEVRRNFFYSFLSFRQVPVDYNAFGMDITIVNIFFGESTVHGDTTTKIQ